MNIFLQLEANPVQMRLLYFYPAVLVNSKLDYHGPIQLNNEIQAHLHGHYKVSDSVRFSLRNSFATIWLGFLLGLEPGGLIAAN